MEQEQQIEVLWNRVFLLEKELVALKRKLEEQKELTAKARELSEQEHGRRIELETILATILNRKGE